ncbi:MAG: DedA family protein [Micromonosporaceae bacterium]
MINDLLDLLDVVPPWQLYLVVGVLLVLETTALIGFVTPGEVVLLAAATTVNTPGEYAALAAVAAGGSLLGQAGGYLIGRRYGSRVRTGWVGRTIGERRWRRAERFLRGGSGRAVAGSRCLAVAHSLVPVLVGTLRMPAARFARYVTLGSVAWGIAYVGLGSAASVAIRESAHLLGPTVTGLAIAALALAVAFHAVRRWRAAAGSRRPGAVTGAPADTGAPAVSGELPEADRDAARRAGTPRG